MVRGFSHNILGANFCGETMISEIYREIFEEEFSQFNQGMRV
jgi:hypothetical protein